MLHIKRNLYEEVNRESNKGSLGDALRIVSYSLLTKVGYQTSLDRIGSVEFELAC